MASRATDDSPSSSGEESDAHDGASGGGIDRVPHLAKGLARYALSCEHSRRPIKRQDINERVLGQHTRLFKQVFAHANNQLIHVFGVQLVELPKAEKVTLRQKRVAAAAAAAASSTSESQTKSSSAWVLQSVLPEQYRIPEIVGPSQPLQGHATNQHDAYVGLYTMVIALITISGGIMAEGKLDRALRRMNAEQSTPVGSKDKALAMMVKDGYIARIKDASGAGDETVDYIVGPRGRVDVGRHGVARFLRAMHGEEEDEAELERRIQRTLNVAEAHNNSV